MSKNWKGNCVEKKTKNLILKFSGGNSYWVLSQIWTDIHGMPNSY